MFFSLSKTIVALALFCLIRHGDAGALAIDDTLAINVDTSDPFTLAEQTGSDVTNQVFELTPDIPVGVTVTCSMTCADAGDTRIRILLAPLGGPNAGALVSDQSPGICDTQVDSGSYTNDSGSEITFYVVAQSHVGTLTDAVISCTSDELLGDEPAESPTSTPCPFAVSLFRGLFSWGW